MKPPVGHVLKEKPGDEVKQTSAGLPLCATGMKQRNKNIFVGNLVIREYRAIEAALSVLLKYVPAADVPALT